MSDEMPPWNRRTLQRTWSIVAVTFALAFALAVALPIVVRVIIEGRGLEPRSSDGAGLFFALMATSFACSVVSWPLYELMKGALGPRPRSRVIRRVVLYRSRALLDVAERHRARAYAAAAVQQLPFVVAQSALLVGAMSSFFLGLADWNRAGEGWLSVLFVVALSTGIIAVALSLAQWRTAVSFHTRARAGGSPGEARAVEREGEP